MIKQPKNISMSVDVRTGGFTYHEVGLVIPARGYDFRFERWQNSLATYSYRNGWSFDWDERLEFGQPDGAVLYWTPSSAMSRFTPNGDGTYSPAVTWTYTTLEEISDGLYQLTYKNGERRIFRRLNEFGVLERKIDTFGNIFSYGWEVFEWSPYPQVVSMRDGSGRTVEVSYSEVEDQERYDLEMTCRDWTGRTFGYRFRDGFATAWVDPEGQVTWTTRTAAFFGVEVVELPNGVWLTNFPVGPIPQATMVGRQVYGNGREVEYSYDQTNRETTVSDDGNVTLYRWNAAGLLVEKVDPLGNTWGYGYDSDNHLILVTEPNLATVETTFDTVGNMLTRTNQKGDTWTYEYHAVFNKVTKITGPAPLSYETEMTYDSVTGALLTRTDPRGKTTSFEYFAGGLLKKVTDPNTNTVEFEYNLFGYLTHVTNGLGKVTTFEVDLVGNQTAAINPLGHRTTRTFDRNNRVLTVTSPMGHTVRMAYDGNGNVTTVTDPLNRGTRFQYSQMDELLRVLNAAGGAVSYAYDLAHNLVRQTDPNGNAYEFDYDALDRQIRATDPMGQVTATTWDPFCGSSTVLDPEGDSTTYVRDVTCLLTRRVFQDFSSFDVTYDVEGRRIGMTQPQAKKFGQFKFGAQKFGYDPADSTSFTWDGSNNLTSVTYPGSNTIAMTWDDGGRLIQLTDIHGTDLDYAWDAANRLLSVTRDGKVTTYAYDDADRLILLTYPNGVTCEFTYDNDSRILRMLWKLDVTVLYDIEYSYDALGNRTRRSVTRAFTPAVVEDFSYDALSRLTRVDEDGSLRHQYRFDPSGNRLLKKSPTLEEFSDYDASDELVATNSVRFQWDRVGQLVEKNDPSETNPTRYDWNYAHRLRKVTLPDLTSAEYRYNGDELRIWRKEPSGDVTSYYWVPGGVLGLSQVLNELDGSEAEKANYVIGPNGLLAIIDGSGNERYYIFDALGSILALTDDTGSVTDTYVYDESGLSTAGSGTTPNPFRFIGQTEDAESGLLYLRNRYYDPSHGRFLRRDPPFYSPRHEVCAGSGAIIHVPNRLARRSHFLQYSYANNDPINLVDLTGLSATRPGSRPSTDPDECEVKAEVCGVCCCVLPGDFLECMADCVFCWGYCFFAGEDLCCDEPGGPVDSCWFCW